VQICHTGPIRLNRRENLEKSGPDDAALRRRVHKKLRRNSARQIRAQRNADEIVVVVRVRS
jgi:hypothetical protein